MPWEVKSEAFATAGWGMRAQSVLVLPLSAISIIFDAYFLFQRTKVNKKVLKPYDFGRILRLFTNFFLILHAK
jgi:hypothetical protein